MKLIKILTIIICLSFSCHMLFSQEAAGDTGGSIVKETQKETGLPDTSDTAGKEPADAGKVEGIVKTGDRPVPDIKTAEETSKKVSTKKIVNKPKPEETVEITESSDTGDGFLLSINEGSFKYKRIPDIKITDTEPVMVEQNKQENAGDENAANSDDSSGKGFFGLSKSTADIVAKGGILLMVLVIFVLYKKRTRSSVRRSSGRNVMNSYRK